MVGVNVVAADSDAEGARLLTSLQQRFLGMRRGVRGPLPRPVPTMDGLLTRLPTDGGLVLRIRKGTTPEPS